MFTTDNEKRMALTLLRILPLILFAPFVWSSTQSTLSLKVDNDGVYGMDREYTSGLFLSYTSRPITPYWFAKPFSLSIWGASSIDKWEVMIGHKMWTPSDIEQYTPAPNERPYAGFLHSEFNYISLHPQQAQRFNLTIGTTGDSALSEQAQKIVHSITKSGDPNGWDYQIDDKVAGSIGYLSHFNLYRTAYDPHYAWELSAIGEVNVGNFRSDISSGMMLRWGSDLAANFGSAQIDSETPFRAGMIGASRSAWFVFAGLEARYRFNDLTIEGDRPLDGLALPPSAYQVTLEPLQATAVLGAVWYGPYVGASFTLTTSNADYKESKHRTHGTGALSLFAFF